MAIKIKVNPNMTPIQQIVKPMPISRTFITDSHFIL